MRKLNYINIACVMPITSAKKEMFDSFKKSIKYPKAILVMNVELHHSICAIISLFIDATNHVAVFGIPSLPSF